MASSGCSLSRDNFDEILHGHMVTRAGGRIGSSKERFQPRFVFTPSPIEYVAYFSSY
jgi:hypothetical protein